MPNDPLIHTFLGFQYLFNGEEEKGKKMLQSIQGVLPDHLVSTDHVVEDYLSGAVPAEGIQAIYQEVDETRDSILSKQKTLATLVKKQPSFRGGLFHLAITDSQSWGGTNKRFLLERYVALDPKNPVVTYYLAALHMQRRD